MPMYDSSGGVAPQVPKKKKKPVTDSWAVRTKSKTTQTADFKNSLHTPLPFKDVSTPKYANESHRLVNSLGIQVHGMENHPDPGAVYTAIGQALHRLPSAAWPWLEKHGKKLQFQVTNDGLVAFDNSGTSDSDRVGGYYRDGEMTVGVPRNKRAFRGDEFTTPTGQTVSARSLTINTIRDVTTHEFAHWLDGQAKSISKKHSELFGNTRDYRAPHDERQWERFAGDLASYLSSNEQRQMLNPNVVKFFDHFIKPQLSNDIGDPSRRLKTMRNESHRKLLMRVAAIKILHEQNLLVPFLSDFVANLKRVEMNLDKVFRKSGGQ